MNATTGIAIIAVVAVVVGLIVRTILHKRRSKDGGVVADAPSGRDRYPVDKP